MRDPARIEPIMEALTAVWKNHPDWRLTQLLVNTGVVPNFPGSWYYDEDDRMLQPMEEAKDADFIARMAYGDPPGP